MIEVEKKFILTEEEQQRLTKGAQFLSERTFTDIYYDSADVVLTSHDKWLRFREGVAELKLPLHQGRERLVDQYEELKDEQKIRDVLSLSAGHHLVKDLEKAGYIPFCICKTTRRKYRHEPFIIDLDIVGFENFTYTIGEIELMVEDASEINEAIEKILSFAKQQNLTIAPVRGKVIEYVKRMRPEHYQTLVQVGVVKDY